MKWNWGTGIAIFYSLFVLVLIFQVIKSTQYDHSLVSDQYYADDLRYQEHYEKLKNTQQLEKDLSIQLSRDHQSVELIFPSEFQRINGEIHFFCPSNSKQDFKVPVRTDPDNRQQIDINQLQPGLWRIKVDWQGGGRSYFKEEVITI